MGRSEADGESANRFEKDRRATAYDIQRPFIASWSQIDAHTDAHTARFARRYTVVFNQTASGSFYYTDCSTYALAASICPAPHPKRHAVHPPLPPRQMEMRQAQTCPVQTRRIKVQTRQVKMHPMKI